MEEVGSCMPTSDASRPSPLWKTLLGVLVLVAALVAIDVALTLALEPYGSNSDSVWFEYRQATAAGEQFDTVVIGSSVAQDSLQPGPIDSTLSTHSFCLASPGQSLESSLEALRTVLDEHPVRRVILGTSYTQLAEEPWANSNMAFYQAMLNGRPLGEQVTGYTRLILNPDYVGKVSSLAFLMPFTLSHVNYTPSAIANNIRNRLECDTPLEAQACIDSTWHPLGQGYANYTGQLNAEVLGANHIGVNHLAYLGLGGKGLNISELRGLEGICKLCNERGVELVVFAAPHPRFEVLSIADAYPTDMAIVEQMVTSQGGIYLDFNMAHADVYDIWESDFIDATHLNMQGAERFTPIFADIVHRAEAHEDMGGFFYSYNEWEDYLASLSGIYYVYVEETPEADTLSLEAISYQGSNVQVEYAYEMQDSESGEWTTLRDWSADATYVIPNDLARYQACNVRILARQPGATEVERRHYQTVSLR